MNLLLNKILLSFLGLLTAGQLSANTESKKAKDAQSEPLKVKIAETQYPVFFEKKGMPFALKETIVKDLERIMKWTERVHFAERDKSHYTGVDNKEGKVKITHRFKWNIPYTRDDFTMVPEVIQQGFTKATKTNETPHLILSGNAVKRYQEALKLKKSHPEMFKNIQDFIKMYEDTERMREILRDPAAFEKHIYKAEGMSKEAAITQLKQLLSKDRTVKYPSILQIRSQKEMFQNVYGYPEKNLKEEVYIMNTLLRFDSDKEGPNIIKVSVGAYVDGQWRVLTYPMP